jgi:N-acetylglutamate synthase-like GNAT family acetyltransferase
MIIIHSPQTKEEFKAYYALRYHLLREPWGQPKGSEKDDYEPISHHYMAVDDQSGEVVGVVKWLEKKPGVAWLTHLAVMPARQKQGIGKLLVQAVENAARVQGYKAIGAHARLNATDYFEKFGYQITDIPTHYFATVQTVWMEKNLE